MRDLVSYDRKHNEGNGEDNRDGTDNNLSWNCGVEGETDDPAINKLRHQQMRNIMATLLLSMGMPMITAGDEFGRTQHGNNNAYCQDNEISWVNWEGRSDVDLELTQFVSNLLAIRRDSLVFRRNRFLTGAVIGDKGLKDVTWLSPSGSEMTQADWSLPYARCLGAQLYGVKDDGAETEEELWIAILNGHHGPISFKLPKPHVFGRWQVVFDTAALTATETLDTTYLKTLEYPLQARSFVLLRDN